LERSDNVADRDHAFAVLKRGYTRNDHAFAVLKRGYTRNDHAFAVLKRGYTRRAGHLEKK